MTQPGPGLDDPRQRAFAWARFRRILLWMALGGAVAAALIVWWLTWIYGALTWVGVLAAFAGVWLSILMAAALMGLAFLSSGSGHDEAVHRWEDDAR